MAGRETRSSTKSSAVASLSRLELLVAGAGAGVVSKTVTAPMDRIRILFQVDPRRQFSVGGFLQTGATIVRQEGVPALWRGNLAVVIRVMPYAGLQFATFDYYQAVVGSACQPGENDKAVRFIAGSMAGATATCATYPLDLLRAQKAVTQGANIEASYSAVAHEIYQLEGVRGLFRGIGPTLLGIIPHAGMSFMVFETLKPWIHRDVLGLDAQQPIPLGWRLVAGGIAGFVAQGASYPLHVVRRRMQVQGMAGASGKLLPRYASVGTALLTIYRKEGLVAGLYKGGSLTLVKGPISSAFAFSTNDLLKHCFKLAHGHAEKCPPTRPNFPEITKPEVSKIPASPLEHLMIGGVAGCVAKTAIAPADRVKILYQINTKRAFTWAGVYATVANIYRTSGLFGFWRGNLATIIRVAPYSGTMFMTFDSYRNAIRKMEVVDEGTTRFLAGAMAGATATSVTYPLDLMRARMAADADVNPRYTSYPSAFRTIVKEEGAQALFNGMRPTMLGIMPYAGLSFFAYEGLKSRISCRMQLRSTDELPTSLRLVSGAVAGLVGQSATYPLDIVRRRMQVGSAYRNELHALRTIYFTEGLVGGLFKGLSMNWLKGPVAVGISFTVNDLLKRQLGRG